MVRKTWQMSLRIGVVDAHLIRVVLNFPTIRAGAVCVMSREPACGAKSNKSRRLRHCLVMIGLETRFTIRFEKHGEFLHFWGDYWARGRFCQAQNLPNALTSIESPASAA